jgi:hypothetical protein
VVVSDFFYFGTASLNYLVGDRKYIVKTSNSEFLNQYLEVHLYKKEKQMEMKAKNNLIVLL